MNGAVLARSLHAAPPLDAPLREPRAAKAAATPAPSEGAFARELHARRCESHAAERRDEKAQAPSDAKTTAPAPQADTGEPAQTPAAQAALASAVTAKDAQPSATQPTRAARRIEAAVAADDAVVAPAAPAASARPLARTPAEAPAAETADRAKPPTKTEAETPPPPAAALADWLNRFAHVIAASATTDERSDGAAPTLQLHPESGAQAQHAPGAATDDDDLARRVGAPVADALVATATPAIANAVLDAAQAAVPRSEARADASASPHVLAAALAAPALAHAAVSASDAPAPLREATLAAPFGTPGFAGALAASVSVLAREQVQQARLHLHPAEMGPIAVQISIDGTQARVDFTAEVAATRHAIEAALPELASALRESGLTLAGGGVFGEAASQRQAAEQRGETGWAQTRSRDEEAPGAATVVRRTVVAGGVDEYA